MARMWEGIIAYEDRSAVTTSRWRLTGVATKEGAENTDGGLLWLVMSRSGDTLTADLYKDDGLASGNKVATGTANVSAVDGDAANAAEVALTEAESSGLSGSFWLHDWQDTPATIPLQVALCTDEDCDGLWDDIANLPGYDSTNGLAEFIRIAGEDILGKLTSIFQERLGGYGASEAWFITDATRSVPDLRRVANPSQLRIACAYHALELAVGRSHQRAESSMYSELRDYFRVNYEQAMGSLQLALKSGSGDNAVDGTSVFTHRMERA